MTVVAMSQSELTRFDFLQRVERGEKRISDAAASLWAWPGKVKIFLEVKGELDDEAATVHEGI